jgi:hypothetical protein
MRFLPSKRLPRPRATALSIYVVRAFVELRGLLSANKDLATKVHALERKVSVHERSIAELADSMAELLATPCTTAQAAYRVHQPQQEDRR